MIRMPQLLLTLSVLAMLATNVEAQRRGGGGPGTPGSATLERTGLKIGQKMPDVTVYDADGKKLKISSLKGKHAVLVFGCLT